MATPTQLGTAISKASGTTLVIPSFTVPYGESLVVGASCANGSLAPDTVVHAGRSLSRREQRNNATQGYHTSAWVKGEYHKAQTGTCVLTWGSAIVERAAVATCWDLAQKKDDGAGQAETTTTTTPGTGTTGTLTTAGTVAICYFGANGPAEDFPGSVTADIQDAGSWESATLGQVAGTTGGGAATNVTIAETYLELASTTATQGRLQSATSRRWANVILVLEPRASWNNQGITPTDTIRVEQMTEDAGGNPDDVVFRKNDLTGQWEAYETTTLGTLRATRDDAGAWS